jgi:hypothetical protein
MKTKDTILLEQAYESIVESNSLFKNIQQLKAESSYLMYDFGGSEAVNVYPEQETITDIVVVDTAKPYAEDVEETDKNLYYVKANLFAPVTLPKPAQEINVSKLFRFGMNDLKKTNVLVDNIDRHLVKGGIVKVFEDSEDPDDDGLDMDPFMLKLIEIFKSKGYTLLRSEGFNYGKYESIVLRK